jgi:hypothetical protein
MPSKFIFMKIMPRENFGELFRFFPQRFDALKNSNQIQIFVKNLRLTPTGDSKGHPNL